MKRLVLVGALAGVFAASTVYAQGTTSTGTSLGTVNLTKKVTAGTYQVRLTNEAPPKPGAGQGAEAEKYVEFVRGGKVMGREVATVVSAADMSQVAKGKKPGANSSSVEMLKGGKYLRVWINHGGNNYIINMPPA